MKVVVGANGGGLWFFGFFVVDRHFFRWVLGEVVKVMMMVVVGGERV